jgi:thiamine pyrophosphate-dependent acetolactate synthase large subunit-like protein
MRWSIGRRGGGARARRATAAADVARAVHRARSSGAVVLMLPLDVQAQEGSSVPVRGVSPAPVRPGDLSAAAAALSRAQRPAIIAGRGAALAGGTGAAAAGQLTGAVLATSAQANGLFAGDPFDPTWRLLDAARATPARGLDVVIAFGAALNVDDAPWRADRAGHDADPVTATS